MRKARKKTAQLHYHYLDLHSCNGFHLNFLVAVQQRAKCTSEAMTIFPCGGLKKSKTIWLQSLIAIFLMAIAKMNVKLQFYQGEKNFFEKFPI